MAAVSAAFEVTTAGHSGMRVVVGRSDIEGNEWHGQLQVCDVSEDGELNVADRRSLWSGVTSIAPIGAPGAAGGAGVVVVGCDSGDAFVVDLAEPRPDGEDEDEDLDAVIGSSSVLGHHHSTVSAVAAVAGGGFATASWDGTAAVWDAETASVVATFGKPTSTSRLLCCAAMPSGLLLVGGEGGVAAHDARAASSASSSPATGSFASAVPVTAAAACGDWLVALGFEHGAVGAVDSRAVSRGLVLWAPRTHRGPVRSVAAAAPGAGAGAAARLVSGADCGTVASMGLTPGSDSVTAAATTRLPSMADSVVAVGTSAAGSWSIDQNGRVAIHS